MFLLFPPPRRSLFCRGSLIVPLKCDELQVRKENLDADEVSEGQGDCTYIFRSEEEGRGGDMYIVYVYTLNVYFHIR